MSTHAEGPPSYRGFALSLREQMPLGRALIIEDSADRLILEYSSPWRWREVWVRRAGSQWLEQISREELPTIAPPH